MIQSISSALITVSFILQTMYMALLVFLSLKEILRMTSYLVTNIIILYYIPKR